MNYYSKQTQSNPIYGEQSRTTCSELACPELACPELACTELACGELVEPVEGVEPISACPYGQNARNWQASRREANRKKIDNS